MQQPALKATTGWILVLPVLVPGLRLAAQITDQTPAPAKDSVVRIQVHADQPAVAEIPATILGSFLEPIGRSTYGGLWAELLENGSLEDGLWSATEVDRMVRERPELLRASQLGPLPWEPLASGESL
jgi:alpha-N-arabinofuranosidase